jgi:hypothetical protein
MTGMGEKPTEVVVAKEQPFRAVGLPYAKIRLTIPEQEELLRVAGGNHDAVTRVVEVVERRFGAFRMAGLAWLGYACLFLVPALLHVGLTLTSGITVIVLCLAVLATVLFAYRRRDLSRGLSVVALLQVLRELQHGTSRFARLCRLVDSAATTFYGDFSDRLDPRWWVLWSSRPPKTYLAPRRAEAERGARAIASLVLHVEGSTPDPIAMADDIRRAILRIAPGDGDTSRTSTCRRALCPSGHVHLSCVERGTG